jgi:hypothetical protein
MTTATDTRRVPLTPEMVGALSYAIKRRLLGLELWGCGDDPLGLMSDEPDLAKIDHMARELGLCGCVLEDLSSEGLIGPVKVEATDELLNLLTRCEDDSYKSIEADEGGNPDDLALSRARHTMLRHTYEHIREAKAGDV